jgi:hypothetical protein
MVASALYGTTVGMPQHYYELGTCYCGGVFQRAQHMVGYDIARHADAEYIAKTLIEYELGRGAAVHATKDRSKWVLLVFGFSHQLQQVSIDADVVDEPMVSFLQ